MEAELHSCTETSLIRPTAKNRHEVTRQQWYYNIQKNQQMPQTLGRFTPTKTREYLGTK